MTEQNGAINRDKPIAILNGTKVEEEKQCECYNGCDYAT